MYVGTVHKNKREIPYEILDKKNISSGQSAFVFTTDMTLVTFESNLSKTQKKTSLSCVLKVVLTLLITCVRSRYAVA